jgi:ATP-binding protein involved in chromosome partitioning
MPTPLAEPTETAVLEALRSVQDPDLHRDIVALGFVKDLRVCGGNVAFQIELTTPACPVKDQMKAQAQRAVSAIPGVAQVEIEMTASVTSSRPVLGDKGMIPGVKNVLAVSSGKGGVGKSTVAVNLACALSATGARVGILDADVYGPNVPLMLGLKGQPRTDNKKIVPFDRYGLQVMSMALLVAEDQPVIWRGPMLHSAVRQFLFDVAWHDLDYLVVDLPPGTGDIHLTLVQKLEVDGVVLVTTPQEIALVDVRRASSMFAKTGTPVLGVIENMAFFPDPSTGEPIPIFGKGGGAAEAKRLGVPLLAEIPIEMALREAGDAGKPLTAQNADGPAAKAFRAAAKALVQKTPSS